jgi:hypothetical protein
MKIIMQWIFGFYFCLASASAWSQQMMCPPGSVPIGGGNAGWVGCSPVPGSTVTPNPGPAWSTRWGAIAIANGVLGAAENASSKRKAEKEAVKHCKQQGGRQCAVVLSYYNQCGALAWGDTYARAYRHVDIPQAEAEAMKSCNSVTNNCKVFYSACSYPERIR